MEFEKGIGRVETVRLSKKEQAEIGNRTKVGNNKDKTDYTKTGREKE